MQRGCKADANSHAPQIGLETDRELGLCSAAHYKAGLGALDGRESEHQAMWRAIEELEGSAQTAAEDAGATERELLTTALTTRAGALRLLRHLADFLDEDDVVNDLRRRCGRRRDPQCNRHLRAGAAGMSAQILPLKKPLRATRTASCMFRRRS